jgi:hypothetical protein
MRRSACPATLDAAAATSRALRQTHASCCSPGRATRSQALWIRVEADRIRAGARGSHLDKRCRGARACSAPRRASSRQTCACRPGSAVMQSRGLPRPGGSVIHLGPGCGTYGLARRHCWVGAGETAGAKIAGPGSLLARMAALTAGWRRAGRAAGCAESQAGARLFTRQPQTQLSSDRRVDHHGICAFTT